MTDLTRLTIAEARTKLRGKEISACELTDAYLGAIDASNQTFNAYVAITHDKAREMAKASDEKLGRGEGRGPAGAASGASVEGAGAGPRKSLS